MDNINELGQSKYFANRGVERFKRPIDNLIYRVEISQLKEGVDESQYPEYKFKDLGYLVLYWTKHKKSDGVWNYHGFITPDDLKEKIGVKQYAKFCQGKREFIIQRRINHTNISING